MTVDALFAVDAGPNRRIRCDTVTIDVVMCGYTLVWE